MSLLINVSQAKQSNPSLAPPQRNIMFMALGNISAEEHVLNTVKKIKAANLQDALLVLPFDRVMQLLTFINIWAEKVRNSLLIYTIINRFLTCT